MVGEVLFRGGVCVHDRTRPFIFKTNSVIGETKLAAAFPFFYINPKDPKFTPIVQKFNKVNADLKDFAPIGNSPVMIHKDELKKVCTVWDTLAIKMKQDPETNAAFGWVLEMWAYSIASAQVGVKYDLVPEFMFAAAADKTEQVREGRKDTFFTTRMVKILTKKDNLLRVKLDIGIGIREISRGRNLRRRLLEIPRERSMRFNDKLMGEMINDGIRSIPDW